MCEDAELVTNELIANVVDHAGTRCTLDVSVTDQGLLIEVRDFYPCPPPQLRPVNPRGRRGARIAGGGGGVLTLGVTPFRDGKSVWALLPRVSPTAVLHAR